MAVLPLYHIKPHVKAPRWAKFPDDFYIIQHCLIDDHILVHPTVSSYRWSYNKPNKKNKCGRARRFEGVSPRRGIFLHRVVWEIEHGPIPDRMTVDHKNLNSLDNRLENLRLATQTEQNRNQSKQDNCSTPYKGSVYHPYGSSKAKKYHGVINPPGYAMCCIGYYHTPEQAAFAYNVAATLCFKEFANLNILPEDSVSDQDKEKIRLSVTQKLSDRGLISSSELVSCLSI